MKTTNMKTANMTPEQYPDTYFEFPVSSEYLKK